MLNNKLDNEMGNVKNCLNCGAENSSKFCSECGQSMNTHRLTTGHILHEIMHYFTHADKGLLFLIKELFVRPGHVIEEYIEGKRKKYFNPYTFLILCSTISAYIYWKLKYYTGMQIQEAPNQSAKEVNELMKQTAVLMEKYGKIITLFMLPLLAGISKLFYLNRKYNYAEHLTIQAFVLAQTSIINIVITLLSYYVFPNSYFIFNILFQISFLLYMAIVNSKIYKENLLLSIVKAIGFLLLFVCSYWILALTVVTTYNKLT